MEGHFAVLPDGQQHQQRYRVVDGQRHDAGGDQEHSGFPDKHGALERTAAGGGYQRVPGCGQQAIDLICDFSQFVVFMLYVYGYVIDARMLSFMF